MSNMTEIIKLMDADPDEKLLRKLCRDGSTFMAKFLLRSGVDPTTRDCYAFRWACRNGHTDIVKALLDDGRVNGHLHSTIMYYSLKWAIRNKAQTVIELLNNHTDRSLLN